MQIVIARLKGYETVYLAGDWSRGDNPWGEKEKKPPECARYLPTAPCGSCFFRLEIDTPRIGKTNCKKALRKTKQEKGP